jgi:hypothetical protein
VELATTCRGEALPTPRQRSVAALRDSTLQDAALLPGFDGVDATYEAVDESEPALL